MTVGTFFNRWSRLFFVSWWVTGVLICLNVVVAFAIDAFLSCAGVATDTSNRFDAAQVTGTETGLQGEYRAETAPHALRRRGTSVSRLLSSEKSRLTYDLGAIY